MFELWGQLVDAICRPPRDENYSSSDLIGGDNGKFRIASSFNGRREDLTLVRKGKRTHAWENHPYCMP